MVHQEDRRKSSANSHALVGDNIFSFHEIDRTGDHGAKTALMHRQSAQASTQAGRYESVPLDEKGLRDHQDESEWV